MNHTDYHDNCLYAESFASEASRKTEKRPYRRIFSRVFPLLLLMTAMLLFTACASDSDKNGEAPSSSSYSAENVKSETENTDAYKVSPLTDFKNASSAYGEVTDMTDQLTYESAAVTNNGINIIYMKTPSADEARRLIFEESADPSDSAASPYITTLRSGSNFDYYEENVPEGTSGTEPFYGYYLRVDGMLILVTGAPENKEIVKNTAGKLFEALGYAAE